MHNYITAQQKLHRDEDGPQGILLTRLHVRVRVVADAREE